MIAMISGHIGITPTEFREHYIELIQKAMILGHKIVVGDAAGVDVMAQAYLFVHEYDNVTVYCNKGFGRPRHNVGKWSIVDVGNKPHEKDAAMTAASDYDIAWVRPGKEDSGTADNLRRRRNTAAYKREKEE